MNKKRITYAGSGVSYELLDAVKRLAQKEAKKTLRSTNLLEMPYSRGESAYVWEEKDCYRAFVIEGLGTKNLIADEMRKITGKTYYDSIARDTVAMIINDLIVVGASPQVINAYFAVGSSGWFSDRKRTADLIKGWGYACRESGAVWGGGETPTLKNIIASQSIDLAGSAIGIIKPKKRLTVGDKLSPGDAIVLVGSSGIHANGLTLARSVAQLSPKGFATLLPDGSSFGEALLKPTHIYAKFIADILENNVDIHYMVNITGHGWRKLMRANRDFTYIINIVPTPQPVFTFIQSISHLTDKEMYETFNMGAGFALFLPASEVSTVQQCAIRHGLNVLHAGIVSTGAKCVRIKPLGITLPGKSLRVRGK
jgi:phosphoribosylformylglycinamidine cyclo-ligase